MQIKTSYYFNVLAFLLLFHSNVFCQSSIVSAGADVVSAGGSVSFTIGIIDYSNYENSSISISEGIQQVFIDEITHITNWENNINIIFYPNPTFEYINMNISEGVLENLNYALTDILGKEIKSSSIINYETIIDLKAMTSGMYFITVFNEKNILKTFKLTKQ